MYPVTDFFILGKQHNVEGSENMNPQWSNAKRSNRADTSQRTFPLADTSLYKVTPETILKQTQYNGH